MAPTEQLVPKPDPANDAANPREEGGKDGEQGKDADRGGGAVSAAVAAAAALGAGGGGAGADVKAEAGEAAVEEDEEADAEAEVDDAQDANDDGDDEDGEKDEENETEHKGDDGGDRGPPTKRARTSSPPAAAAPPIDPAIRLAVLRYKRRRGRAYSVTYDSTEPRGPVGSGGYGPTSPGSGEFHHPLGIVLSAVRVRKAHNCVAAVYPLANAGAEYKGRPPAPSDQSIMVRGLTDSASDLTRERVKEHDVLVFVDDRLVNVTDKKRVKYFRSKVNGAGRPLKLTFFRPEGDEDDDDDEDEDMEGEEGKKKELTEAELDELASAAPAELEPTEGFVLGSTYEPPKEDPPPEAKSLVSVATREERDARREVLERRMREFESLRAEASAELASLRARDGLDEASMELAAAASSGTGTGTGMGKGGEGDAGGEDLPKKVVAGRPLPAVKGTEPYAIPPHIPYYPPTRVRRKNYKSLDEACRRVENLLRQRSMVDAEAERVRETIRVDEKRLKVREQEMEEIEERVAPALEQVKFLEMEVADNWKGMYLKLKGEDDMNCARGWDSDGARSNPSARQCRRPALAIARLWILLVVMPLCYHVVQKAQKSARFNAGATRGPPKLCVRGDVPSWHLLSGNRQRLARRQQLQALTVESNRRKMLHPYSSIALIYCFLITEYYEEHGHSNVMEKEDAKMAKWVTRQRTCYANGQLERPSPSMGIVRPYQIDLLNRLEFCWNPREQQFAQNISLLAAFRAENGHANVPNKYSNQQLANFVQKWRREYRLFREGKPSNMTADRLRILEDAGFTWRDPSRTRYRSDKKEETWDMFMRQLREFKEKYGHFMVNKLNKSLHKGSKVHRLNEFCVWVRKQYALYKEESSECQLTDEKVAQLEEMGFWLERGEAQKYRASMDGVAHMGELQVPTIGDAAGDQSSGKDEETDAETRAQAIKAMLDAASAAAASGVEV
ncbi:hypothetical protein ACHAWF_011740 [Thalassiosira exigua]